MSEVTDMRCAVSNGDFAAGALPLVFAGRDSSSLSSSLSSLEPVERSVLVSCVADDKDSRLLRSERDCDCDRSGCVSGRGVFSGASSKLS